MFISDFLQIGKVVQKLEIRRQHGDLRSLLSFLKKERTNPKEIHCEYMNWNELIMYTV
jgi:hypothetical protein